MSLQLLEQRVGALRVGLPGHVDEAARAVAQRVVDGDRVEVQRARDHERLALRVLHLARVGVDGRRLLADRELLAVAVEDRAAPAPASSTVAWCWPRASRVERRRRTPCSQAARAEAAAKASDEDGEQEPDAAVGELRGSPREIQVRRRSWSGSAGTSPSFVAREAARSRRGGRARELRRELGVLGAKLVDALAAELVEANVQLEHGDVERDDAGEQDGEHDDPDDAAGARCARARGLGARRADAAARARGRGERRAPRPRTPSPSALTAARSRARGRAPRGFAAISAALGRIAFARQRAQRSARCRRRRPGSPAGRCSRVPPHGRSA